MLKDNNMENRITFRDLQWDTEYFRVNCAKAILNETLTLDEWIDLKRRFKNYNFISIENRNSNPINAQLIGKDTTAFLADVNIQFKKKLKGRCETPRNIEIYQALEPNDEVIEIAEFQFSKFTEDPELAKRDGHRVYQQWLINAFGRSDKYFELSKNEKGEVNGFLLHSYSGNACVVELISVSKKVTHGGVGTSLFRAVEYAAYVRGCDEVRVGTQIRNIRAINFYNKVGCKQVGCHQVYHLWNL